MFEIVRITYINLWYFKICVSDQLFNFLTFALCVPPPSCSLSKIQPKILFISFQFILIGAAQRTKLQILSIFSIIKNCKL